MRGFVQDIENLTVKNDEYRRVLYTAEHCQLVVMALQPREEIGAEETNMKGVTMAAISFAKDTHEARVSAWNC